MKDEDGEHLLGGAGIVAIVMFLSVSGVEL